MAVQTPSPAGSVAGIGSKDSARLPGFERDGYEHEVAFWDRELSLTGEFSENIRHRIDPAQRHLEFPHYVLPHLDVIRTAYPGQRLKVLDVGCGPLTNMAWGFDQGLFDLVAVDPLGDRYRELHTRHHITFSVPPTRCRAEDVAARFARAKFHLVYSRNALDHAEDIQRCFTAIAEVLKPHGRFFIETFSCEGEHANYEGLHSYNFFSRGGEFHCHDRHDRPVLNLKAAGLRPLAVTPPDVRARGGWIAAIFEKG